jgi:uncharacterized protein YfaQ (DUF2300 family)
MRMRLAAIALLASCAVQAAPLDVAWWQDGATKVVQLRDAGRALPAFDGSRPVPLGSLWKLFVFTYAVDTDTAMPDYPCRGREPEEVYCCTPGNSIARDAALAQSCGLFFAPQRLMLSNDAWRRYWTRRLGRPVTGDFAWLADPAQLTPERTVRLDSLLRALASVPEAARTEAAGALLRVVLDGRAAGTARWLGSALRIKTYSWFADAKKGERLGGGAGWLADGTPVWFGGQGTSSTILQQWAPRLAAALPGVPPAQDSGCVLVDYFARYPIRSVRSATGPATPGPLVGSFQVRFDNGQSLALRSNGELVLGAGKPQLRGRLGVNEYVARVIDREASAAEPEAAKALAVAARTYLQQNGRREGACQRIADSSSAQRVSPNPATPAALAIAGWTDQLILDGVQVRYHSTRSADNTLSWSAAVQQARQGKRYDEVLAFAFPGAALASIGNLGAPCRRLPQNEAWLARALPRWARVLQREPGYETPAQQPAVCELDGGAPYSEQARNRIFMRPLAAREDRITLAHEFLHLGLRNHPRGQDEIFVEQLARRLVDVPLESL